mmetsp:Transcript_81605/g.141805  ORF Transcript_81605/g.141805 Transcript_81605/m.141805 type:complete len:1360 (-) Transcript_81605:93-4172(-)
MASMSDVNDENVQPERPNVVNFQPNDKDRLRFGFKKRPTGTAPAADPGLRQPGPAPALAHSPVPSLRSAVAELQTVRQLTPRSQRPTTPRSQRPSLAPPPSVDLLALHDKHLGDSEDLTAMLKRNPTSSKYEFKERMAELEKINKEFKTALSDVSKRSKLLREGLAPAQDEVNAWLQDSRNALHDEQRKAESEQESLRQRGKQDLEALRQQLLQEQASFRSQSEAEQAAARKRAEEAEAKLHETETSLQEVRKDLDDSKGLCKETEAKHKDSERRVGQAQELLQQHISDTKEVQQKLQSDFEKELKQQTMASKKRECELLGDLDDREAKNKDLLAQIKEQEQQLLARDEALREAAQRQREQVDQMQAEKQRIHTLELDHSQQLQKLHSEHSDQLDLEHQRVQKLESDHGEQLKKLRSEQCEKLLLEQQKTQKMEHDHSQQMQRLKSDHSEALALEQQRVQKLEHEHHQQIQKLQVEHNEQLQVEQERAQRQEREHGEQLQQTQRDHSEQQHADQQRIQQLESSHLERVQRLEREHGERLQQLQRDHSEQQLSEQQRLEQNHAEEVQLERQRYEQLQADLAASRQTNAELRAALHSVESERDRFSTSFEESQAEVDARRETASQANAVHQAHVKAHTALKCEHAKLQDVANERQAAITVLEGKLDEAERQLLRKDTDLREQIRQEQQQKQKLEHTHSEQLQRLQSEHGEELRLKQQEVQKLEHFQSQQVQKLHSEHSEQLRVEQQRARTLEHTYSQQLQKAQSERSEELKTERSKAQQLEDNLREQLRKLQSEQAAQLEQLYSKHGNQRQQDQHRLDQLESSHSEQLQSNARLQAQLESAESEKERLTSLLAESQSDLSTQKAALREAATSQQSLREELAGVRATLEVTSDQATSLKQEKHVLELEFHSYKEHHGSSNERQMEAITELKLVVDRLNQKVDNQQLELGVQQGNMMEQQSYVKNLERQLCQAEKTRRDLHNAIQELKGNIRVFCRIRPALPSREVALQCSDAANKLCLTYGSESYNFAFDNIFGVTTSQVDIFEEVTGLVQSALDGYKVCIFAYGQTGSGKTFTMQGTEEKKNWGLIPRSLQQIFQASEAMRAQGWNWELQASFLEVYNETIRDLLRPGNAASSDSGSASGQHVIKHDDAWGTMVTNVTSVEVDSMGQINSLMARAAQQRAVGSTDMNAVSSRSHSIFALYLRGTNEELDSELHGALHLVDLAGSERLSKSGATGDRLKETQNINKSLSSLADVFLAKAESRAHVPFRNSKLTHLMEPCLSGQGKTLMMVNVGPEEDNAHETLCSLRFASQVNQCDTGGKPKRSAKKANQDSTQRRPQASSSRPQSAAPTTSSAAARTGRMR